MFRAGMKRGQTLQNPISSRRVEARARLTALSSSRLLTWAVLLMLSVNARAEVALHADPVAKLLNEWFAEGSAAGLSWIAYENRDEGHSMFDHQNYPQMEFFHAPPEEQARAPIKGPAVAVRPSPTFANSSMAAPADKGGSLPRLAYYFDQNGLVFLGGQYLHNNLCFYPEHQDHDEGFNGRGGWGDLYPTNTPYLLISQGSSFTDKPFLQAFIRATAALKPEVQSALIKTRLLMPTLQSLFRQTCRPVKSEADYFTGKAHPVVFDGSQIDEERFVRRAHGMTPAAIPPIVLLEVQKESQAQMGRDYFEDRDALTEHIGDSPCVIARTFRSSAFRHEMTVTARKTGDLMNRLLDFKWVLLQGDPDRVQIKPSPTGEEAQISVAWHPLIRPKDNISSHRVDIGVFAFNGVTWSAPSFITFYMLPNEARFYSPKGQLEEICYEAGNPDIGLPELTDLRWLSFGRKLSVGSGLSNMLLRQNLPMSSIKALKKIADDLADAQAAWRKLDADKERKADADKALAALKDQLAKGLRQTIKEGNQPLWKSVEAAVSTLADDPTLYPAMQDQIRGLTRASSKPNAADEVLNATKRLVSALILERTSKDEVALRYAPQKLTQGERYQLRQLNLTVLSEALLPEFLERSTAPAFVDPRVTALRDWRDVYRYNKNNECTGWTRIAGGQEHEFDAEGRLLPDGRKGPAVTVRYVKDATNGKLTFVAK